MDTEDELLNDGQQLQETKPTSFIELFDLLDKREALFVSEYIKDCIATRAVVRCGFSEKSESAAVIGSRMLRNVKVLACVNAFLNEKAMSATEAIKNVSDIARSNLSDYMVVKKVLKSDMVRKPLRLIITEQENKIDFEREYGQSIRMSKAEAKRHAERVKGLENDLIRLRIELRRNPKAYRDVQGEPKWVDEADLDLVKLAKDKELGRIKSWTPTEYGVKVEMYAADTNLERILKYHGKLPEKIEHSGPNGGPIETNQTRSWIIANHSGVNTTPAPDEDYHKAK
ncbi:hypothetical protein GCM10028805_22640 [Spirosoma harenae]